MSLSTALTGPRALDPHTLNRVTEGTKTRYRNCLRKIIAFVINNHFVFSDPEELDDLLVEWKNSASGVTRSDFEGVIVAVEACRPSACKGPERSKSEGAHGTMNWLIFKMRTAQPLMLRPIGGRCVEVKREHGSDSGQWQWF